MAGFILTIAAIVIPVFVAATYAYFAGKSDRAYKEYIIKKTLVDLIRRNHGH